MIEGMAAMFKWVIAIRKKRGLSREAFIDYYENHHVPRMTALVPLPAIYRRNYVVLDDPLLAVDGRGGGEEDLPFDCLTECVFDTREEAQRLVAAFSRPEILAIIAADEAHFIEPGCQKMYIVEVRGAPAA